MSVGGLLLVALGIAIGMVGIVVPTVPGAGLVVLSIGAWALVESTTKAWVVLGIVVALAVATTVAKYVWPAARMREAGVPALSLVLGGIAAVVGFPVVPLVFLATLPFRTVRVGGSVGDLLVLVALCVIYTQ